VYVEAYVGGVAQLLGCRHFRCPMPDLWLVDDHFVGKLSTMNQLTRPTQPSIPTSSANNPCIFLDYGGETIKRQTRLISP